jgi:predicted translin family RNA/ssDNA-binding protein
MSFTRSRVRKLGEKLPPFVEKNNKQYWETIEKQYKSICGDLQGPNMYRYGRQITGGNQEFMEAVSFQHYLEMQKLLSYEEARKRVASLSGEAGPVLLTPEDYLLGVFDMVGELMRFSVTAIATNGKLPVGKPQTQESSKAEPQEPGADPMEVDEPESSAPVKGRPRDVLSDLRELRLHLEMFEPVLGSPFADDVSKKMEVMQQCVEKVEKALYGLIVRQSEGEVPRGWVPDLREDNRGAREVEGY